MSLIVKTGFQRFLESTSAHLQVINPWILATKTLFKFLPPNVRQIANLTALISRPFSGLIPITPALVVQKISQGVKKHTIKDFLQQKVLKPLFSRLPGPLSFLNRKITRLVVASFITASALSNNWTVIGLANKTICKYVIQNSLLKRIARSLPRPFQDILGHRITRFLIANIAISMLLA